MAERHPPRTPPSGPDGDGVRVVPKSHHALRARAWWVVVAVIAVVAAVAWWWLVAMPHRGPQAEAPIASTDADGPAPASAGNSPRATHAVPAADEQAATPTPGNDPDDLAAYFQPGDPEPTGAQVVNALREAGVRTGLGAFNPPGTSPPLEGLAVPDDFDLPEGYVRHHQVTDEGVPIEPILMFSPEATLHDAQGRPIPLPANRVVPPELAPPGLPRRWVRVGKP